MKSYVTGIAVAALLVIGPTLPGYAEDTAAPAAPSATRAEPPPSVPRPSLAPKPAEPATAPAASKTTEPDVKSASDERPRHRRYAHRYGRYGYYRTAYWEPFPLLWPHVYRNRIHWNRIPWAFRF
jgi:hypothetical protein